MTEKIRLTDFQMQPILKAVTERAQRQYYETGYRDGAASQPVTVWVVYNALSECAAGVYSSEERARAAMEQTGHPTWYECEDFEIDAELVG